MTKDVKTNNTHTYYTHTHTNFKTIIKKSPHLTSRRLKQSKIKFFIVSPNLSPLPLFQIYTPKHRPTFLFIMLPNCLIKTSISLAVNIFHLMMSMMSVKNAEDQ